MTNYDYIRENGTLIQRIKKIFPKQNKKEEVNLEQFDNLRLAEWNKEKRKRKQRVWSTTWKKKV